MIERLLPGSSWHRHRNVRCHECKTTVHSTAVCVKRSRLPKRVVALLCWVPRNTYCNACRERARAA